MHKTVCFYTYKKVEMKWLLENIYKYTYKYVQNKKNISNISSDNRHYITYIKIVYLSDITDYIL